MSKNLALILIFVIIILLTIVGYFIFQNQKLIGKLTIPTSTSPPVTSIPTVQPSPISTPSPSPKLTKAQVEENIQAAVNSGNFAALASYMTKPKINFTLMSTECCQPMTPDEAVNQMSYISEGIPMDFNQANTNIANLKSKNQQLADAFIGLSKNDEHLAAFTLDAQTRISAIQLSVSWKLYNY